MPGIVQTKVELPSRGVLYGERIPGGMVTLRPMTMKEEKLLLGTQKDRGRILDDVISRCISLPEGFKYEDLLIGDKVFLLFAIRNVSYGADYRYSISCSNCQQAFIHQLKIPEELEIRALVEDEDTEPFFIELPVSKHKLGLKLLRVKDEWSVQSYISRLPTQMASSGDPGYIYRLALYIVSVDGTEKTLADRLVLCENLVGMDSLALRDAVDGHECGLNLMLNVGCPFCGVKSEQPLMLTAEFFRPGSTNRPSRAGSPGGIG